jgi:hypothetical protein
VNLEAQEIEEAKEVKDEGSRERHRERKALWRPVFWARLKSCPDEFHL